MQANDTKEAGGRSSMLTRLAHVLGDQRTLFLMVGGANTVFATAFFAGLVLLFGKSVPSVVSLCIAWAVSLLTGYLAHRMLVFRAEGHFWSGLVRFAGVNYMTLLINIGALGLLSDVMGLPPIPAQIGIFCFTIAFNYFGHKYFSFWRNRE